MDCSGSSPTPRTATDGPRDRTEDHAGTPIVDAAAVGVRAELEAVFNLAAIAEHEEGLDLFINDDMHQRRTLFNKIRDSKSKIFDGIKDHATQALYDEISATIDEKDIKKLSTKRIAEMAGMEDWYLTIYWATSGPVHSRARDLERYFRLDDEGQVHGLSVGPTPAETMSNLAFASFALLPAWEALAAIFEVDVDSEVADFQNKLRAVFVSTAGESSSDA